jgi:hypothetical protein
MGLIEGDFNEDEIDFQLIEENKDGINGQKGWPCS